MITEAQGVTISMAFILYKLLFRKTINAKLIVNGLCNPELIVVDIWDQIHKRSQILAVISAEIFVSAEVRLKMRFTKGISAEITVSAKFELPMKTFVYKICLETNHI